MEEYVVKILSIENVTHDVNRIVTEKPDGYSFIPGQATEASVNLPEFKDKKRPFTFTGLSDWEQLEFTIKSYDDHDGVTKQIGELKDGDELILREVWGSIKYKNKGVFIAGGAGVTPFIAIIRDLHKQNKLEGNKLIFSNKTAEDIILESEFSDLLGDNFINILTREKADKYFNGHIDASFLKSHISDFKQAFYICGPKSFVKSVKEMLTSLGADTDSVVIEK